jgi:hypothetical protein
MHIQLLSSSSNARLHHRIQLSHPVLLQTQNPRNFLVGPLLQAFSQAFSHHSHEEGRKKERRRRNKPVPTTLAPRLVNFIASSLDTYRNAFLLLFFFPAAPPPPPHVYSSSLWHSSHPYTCEVGCLSFQAMATSNPSVKVQVQNPLLLSLLYNCY